MSRPKKFVSVEFDSRRVNRNFRIKIYGDSVNTLVGCKGLISAVGVELANVLVNRAFNCGEDVFHRKLRRGLKVSFYWK